MQKTLHLSLVQMARRRVFAAIAVIPILVMLAFGPMSANHTAHAAQTPSLRADITPSICGGGSITPCLS